MSLKEKATVSTQLRRIAELYIDENSSPVELIEARTRYRELIESTGYKSEVGTMKAPNIALDQGVAVAKKWAELCLDELQRTRQFVAGTYLAIKKVLETKSGPVHLLYAGTGPFATIVLPLTSLFTPAEVQFTFLEINPESRQSALQLWDALQVSDYIRRSELTDACKYRIRQGESIDIILTETMNYGLSQELQVPITLNLTQQAPEAILVPEKVVLKVAYRNESIDILPNAPEKHQVFGPLLCLDKKSFEQVSIEDEMTSFASVKYGLPRNDSTYDRLCVLTEITVFEKQILQNEDCSLTLPFHLKHMDEIPSNATHAAVQYTIRTEPKIEVHLYRDSET